MEGSEGSPDLRGYLKDEGFDCFGDELWEELEDHVKVHKYFLDRNSGGEGESSWEEALDSWYRAVFKPLRLASDSEEIHKAFPGEHCGELYIAVSHHWLFMKQYDPATTPAQAAHDYAIRYGKGLRRWYKRVDETGMI